MAPDDCKADHSTLDERNFGRIRASASCARRVRRLSTGRSVDSTLFDPAGQGNAGVDAKVTRRALGPKRSMLHATACRRSASRSSRTRPAWRSGVALGCNRRVHRTLLFHARLHAEAGEVLRRRIAVRQHLPDLVAVEARLVGVHGLAEIVAAIHRLRGNGRGDHEGRDDQCECRLHSVVTRHLAIRNQRSFRAMHAAFRPASPSGL